MYTGLSLNYPLFLSYPIDYDFSIDTLEKL